MGLQPKRGILTVPRFGSEEHFTVRCTDLNWLCSPDAFGRHSVVICKTTITNTIDGRF